MLYSTGFSGPNTMAIIVKLHWGGFILWNVNKYWSFHFDFWDTKLWSIFKMRSYYFYLFSKFSFSIKPQHDLFSLLIIQCLRSAAGWLQMKFLYYFHWRLITFWFPLVYARCQSISPCCNCTFVLRLHFSSLSYHMQGGMWQETCNSSGQKAFSLLQFEVRFLSFPNIPCIKEGKKIELLK